MRKKLFALMPLAALALASCSSTKSYNLYSWHNYEDASYTYQKRLTEEAQNSLLAEYGRMAANQKATRAVVPPGFKAEYGYLLYKSGKQAEGISMMKEEIALYPESEVYIGKIIKQLEKK